MIKGISKPVPQSQGSVLQGNNNFNRALEESEEEIARIAKLHNNQSLKEQVLELDEISLRCALLDNDPTFKKLKKYLKAYTIRSDECIQNGTTHQIVDFHHQNKIHESLRLMLREISHYNTEESQKLYLQTAYKWYLRKLNSIGALSVSQKQNEDEFMHHDKYAEKEKKKAQAALFQKKRL